MKLGLLTDIHERVEHLRTALKRFEMERVNQVVVIGDLFEMGERIEETCRLLTEARAVGVWGNHDYGLCVEPTDRTRDKYPRAVLEYMASLRPRLEIEGCHFTHVEPWLDPEVLSDLWYFDGLPDDQNKLDRIFNAVPHRVMFAGHFHKWLVARPECIDDWAGDRSVRLHEGRYFVIVDALHGGHYAIFDTDTSELVPFNES